MQSAAFILAHGEPMPKARRDRLRKGRLCLVLDGAAEQVRKEGWLPDLISGDFDSIKPATLAYFRAKGVSLLPTPDQDYSDLEKALAWCALKEFNSIYVAQGTGGRLDHTLANLSLLRRFHARGRELCLFSPTECIRFASDETVRLVGPAGRGLSVIPFPAAIVTSKGLKFEMKKQGLALGVRESSSNSARLATVKLDIEGEALILEEYK